MVHYFDPDPQVIPLFLQITYKVPVVETLGWLRDLQRAYRGGETPCRGVFEYGEWMFEIRLGTNGWEVESALRPVAQS